MDKRREQARPKDLPAEVEDLREAFFVATLQVFKKREGCLAFSQPSLGSLDCSLNL
jgi:hypothetical protein